MGQRHVRVPSFQHAASLELYLTLSIIRSWVFLHSYPTTLRSLPFVISTATWHPLLVTPHGPLLSFHTCTLRWKGRVSPSNQSQACIRDLCHAAKQLSTYREHTPEVALNESVNKGIGMYL